MMASRKKDTGFKRLEKRAQNTGRQEENQAPGPSPVKPSPHPARKNGFFRHAPEKGLTLKGEQAIESPCIDVPSIASIAQLVEQLIRNQ